MKPPRWMLSKKRKGLLRMLCFALAFTGSSVMAESAGSVEGGLAMLAKQIVEKSIAADRKTISVLPFPNSDGSCSVLSTYLVDELILGLFSVPDSPVTIIERAQLEALISEMSIGKGGLLSPETTQKLGSVSGVQALTVGTITVIGDSVRVNARLVNTASGKTISAAGVTLPRTSAVTQLLQQPLSRDVACGSNSGRSAMRVSSGSSSMGGSMVSTVPILSPGSAATFQAGSVSIQINNIVETKEGQYKVLGLVSNSMDQDVTVMWLGSMVMIDTLGNEISAESSTGIQPCLEPYGRGWATRYARCSNADSDYVVITPGSPRNFLMTFGDSKNKTKLGSQVALSGRIWVKGSEEKELPMNFPALMIPEK